MLNVKKTRQGYQDKDTGQGYRTRMQDRDVGLGYQDEDTRQGYRTSIQDKYTGKRYRTRILDNATGQ